MEKIRWGLIGCGDVARKRVAAALQAEPRSSLVAASRRDPVKLQQFCKAFQVPRSYTDPHQLLASSDIDAVYIATPVKEHQPQAMAAAAAGSMCSLKNRWHVLHRNVLLLSQLAAE